MKATPYFLTAVSRRRVVSNASGRRAHIYTPASGTLHSEPTGNLVGSAANIASLRHLYSARKRSKCCGRKPESNIEETTCWENVVMSMSDDSFKIARWDVSSSGTTSQPTRALGAKIFEKDPT